MADHLYGLTESTPPTTEPITLEEAKLAARVFTAADDAFITDLITACRQSAENELNLILVSTTFAWVLDKWPAGGVLRPPRSPLVSVTSIKYQDVDDTEQTLATSVYMVDTSRRPGRIYEAENQSWPDLRGNRNDVTVTFVAGFGAASAVPQCINTGIKMMVGHLYNHREEYTPDKLHPVPGAVQRVFDPERLREAG